MNENTENLSDLKEALEAIEKEHPEALALEPTIARPLHQAADEARRRFRHVTEGHADSGKMTKQERINHYWKRPADQE